MIVMQVRRILSNDESSSDCISDCSDLPRASSCFAERRSRLAATAFDDDGTVLCFAEEDAVAEYWNVGERACDEKIVRSRETISGLRETRNSLIERVSISLIVLKLVRRQENTD